MSHKDAARALFRVLSAGLTLIVVVIQINDSRISAVAPASRVNRDAFTAPSSPKTVIPFPEAQPIIDAHRDGLPLELRGKTGMDLEAVWPLWVKRLDASIRARLARGDEDSIVNFWYYGMSFTDLPRATNNGLATFRGVGPADERLAELLQRRLDDLVRGLASPARNERLEFARAVITRQGLDPSTPMGEEHAKQFLIAAGARMAAEVKHYDDELQNAQARDDQGVYATLYQTRGLSSDTSILVDFSVEQALRMMERSGKLASGSVRRAAIIGPGLDFTDKAEGYDFYPQQSLQPFALIDSLTRLGLSTSGRLQVTTFDISPRINDHLENARKHALAGEGYVVHLPLAAEGPQREWNANVAEYWQRFGDRIGLEVTANAAPLERGVRVRAVSVSPQAVLTVTPQDLDIVVERTTKESDVSRFDLIVATNVLLYYDSFEQALALANISKMLKPGGLLLTNYRVPESPSMRALPALTTRVYWHRTQRDAGDTMFWYQRS